MDWRQYIHSDPNLAIGKPVVKGTRLAVEFLLDLYGAGWTEAQISENYPHLTPEALRAVHAYAAESVRLTKRRVEQDWYHYQEPCAEAHGYWARTP